MLPLRREAGSGLAGGTRCDTEASIGRITVAFLNPRYLPHHASQLSAPRCTHRGDGADPQPSSGLPGILGLE